MNKHSLLATQIILGIIAAAMIYSAFSSTKHENTVSDYRGCVASAHQADARGIAGSTLEANLAECEKINKSASN